MRRILPCFTGSDARTSSPQPQTAAILAHASVRSSNVGHGDASSVDAAAQTGHTANNNNASSQALSLASSAFAEAPSMMTVFDLDWLGASSFTGDQAMSHSPLMQTNLASDYYDQALNLQGHQVTSRQLLTHLLDQHPRGLIPALIEIHEAISNGRQWKHVCQVKVPAIVKASQVTDPSSLPAPPPQEQQMHCARPSLALPSALDMLASNRSRTQCSPMRTMSLIQQIESNAGEIEHQTQHLAPSYTTATMKKIASSPLFDIEFELRQDVGLPADASAAPAIHLEDLIKGGEEEAWKEPEAFLWLEVVAKPLAAPESGKKLVLIQQSDISTHVDQLSKLSSHLMLATKCESLSEQQLALLSASFPRHILEHLMRPMAEHSNANTRENSNALLNLDLPSELDPSSRLLASPSHHLARIPTKGFEKLARSHQGVTILFMDIVGFTSMCKLVPPTSVMAFLNQLFSLFDRLSDKYSVQKIETAGDCYVAAVGILQDDNEGFSVVKESSDSTRNAIRMLQFAKAVLIASKSVIMPHNRQPVSIRIGLHTGDCVTGVVGSKLPKFSVFGDTMNTASRMESTCTPGLIQVSESTWQLLKHVDQWRSTGGIEVKGKGLMNTYYLIDPEGRPQTNDNVTDAIDLSGGYIME